ncbi:GumC family protein [Devosia sp. ZB163]|uniref:GumC family protein n=1 Tax=Devosia sp. ZB163 TaxID=3025938 RepID=UPI00235EF929|nr:GumC family protein [Devosia sp. ZB163]MDC9826308.1 GumC family protein [Devosia sp. ZB163]
MSEITDRPISDTFQSGARAFARLGGDDDTEHEAIMARLNRSAGPTRARAEAPRPAVAPPLSPNYGEPAPVPVETVTLNKIGDFLELDLGRLFTWLGRGRKLATGLALVGAVAGGLFGVFGTPRFTVSTDIMIDPVNLQVVSDDLFQQPGQADSALLNAGSKLRVLTSGNVLLRVVDELNLTADKEFYDPTPGFSLSSLLPLGGDKAEPNPRLAALAALTRKVSTEADEKSFVATLRVSAQTPQKAVAIANAMVDAFQAELATAESSGAARTADSLNQRLDELKGAVRTAEEKVEAYKRANNLSASAGELVSNQTLTQYNAQVVEAQARVIAAQSAYDELVAAGGNASTADTQASAALAGVRARISELRAQLDSQSMVYGPRHPTVTRLNVELAVAQSELDAEISRVVTAARVTLDEASSALRALTAKADALKASVFSDNEALVALRELERDAASKTTIYEAFLSRAKQVAEREQIDATNVRVISPAVPPSDRSSPPKTLVLLFAGAVGGFAVGMLIAVILGIWRDLKRGRHEQSLSAA